MNFKLKEIVVKIAKDNNLTFEQVRLILESEFKAVKAIMKEGTHDDPDSFKNINIPRLGKIYCKKGVVERMKKMKNKKEGKNE